MHLTISTIEIQVTLHGRPSFGWPHLEAMIGVWRQRRRQRQALSGLDDRLLKDIGISRAAAREEAAKPFWKI